MPMGENEMPGNAPRQDQLLEEASLWFARMRGPDAERYRADFDAWLALGAAHLGAYNRAGEIFALGKFLAESPNAATDVDDNDNDGYPTPSRWRQLALLASFLMIVGFGAWVGRDSLSNIFGRTTEIASVRPAAAPDGQLFSTVGGMRRSFKLDDGSTVTLDAESVLAAAFDSQRRELRLKQGRARFDVAHETRPFVVLAGGGSVTARGTIFDVILNRDDGVTVRLLRGAVDVERPSKTGGADRDKQAITRLAPGEELSFGISGLPDLASATRGRDAVGVASLPDIPAAREFDMAPLSEVIAEANRGSGIPIRVSDPAVGAIKVSGRFRIDNPERVADRLATLFDLEVDRTRQDEILLRPR